MVGGSRKTLNCAEKDHCFLKIIRVAIPGISVMAVPGEYDRLMVVLWPTGTPYS